MNHRRKHLYPDNWPALARACKQHAHWRCQSCRIRQGDWRDSKRTGEPYQVWLHAAHVYLSDTQNPLPRLRCLCPTCHGRYDYRQRLRHDRVEAERLRHRLRRERQSQKEGPA